MEVMPALFKFSVFNTPRAVNSTFSLQFEYLPTDTVLNFIFSTIHPRDLGKISGKIDLKDIPDTSSVFITATDINRKLDYTISTRQPHFTFNEIRDGYYTINAWVDINNNNLYDVGTLIPLDFPEPFWFAADTLKVRKRWENRSTVIIF